MSALYLISQYMNLPVPIVGQDPGPDWANNINISLSTIDSHDHTNGRGQAITPNAININSALTFANQDLTNAHSLGLFAQSGILNTSYIGALSNINGNLYFNNSSGFAVQITNNNAIVGTPGNIAGLVAPASATFNAGLGKFIWQANAGVPASMDSGPLIIRDLFPPALVYHSVTISAPSGLTTDYALTLPTLPAASEPYFVTLDSTGTMSAPWTVDHTSLDIISNKVSLHTIPNNTILGNISGGTAVPTSLTASQFYTAFTNPGKPIVTILNAGASGYRPFTAGCTWAIIDMVAGGGGGGAGTVLGASGGQSQFGSYTVSGGGNCPDFLSPGEGGTLTSNGSIPNLVSAQGGYAINGGRGQGGILLYNGGLGNYCMGGQGGSTPLGQGGTGNPHTGTVNIGGTGTNGFYGAGGGGASATNTNGTYFGAAGGGGGGGFLRLYALNTGFNIFYAVGVGGAGAPAHGAIVNVTTVNYGDISGSGIGGGRGGDGIIIITEFFN